MGQLRGTGLSTGGTLCLLVPGPLDQRTGGYLYNRRMMAWLADRGWQVSVPRLEGRFPDPDARAGKAVADAFGACPEDTTLLVDSLVLPTLAEVPRDVVRGRTIIALVHHLASDETGIPQATRRRLSEREQEALPRASGVIVTSAYTSDRVARAGADPERIRVVVPGTDPAPAANGPQAGEPAMLLCVGALVPRKGQDVLVHALSLERARSWRCVLAGSTGRDPEFVLRVRRLVEEEGLYNRIEFAGECTGEELARLYDRASVFVLPSYFEGYGMALTEAIARGLPVISTNSGAIPHTVPGDAGILVPAGDAQALGAAVASLLEGSIGEGGRRAGLASAARRHAASLPDWETQAGALAEALRSLGSPTPTLPRES